MESPESHNSIGVKGEKIAVRYLLKEGYTILEMNYRFKRSEIDIIAMQDNILVFVEVKTRRSIKFGLPEESISTRKSKNVMLGAENYIATIGWEKDLRFDVIAVTIGDGLKVEHIKDVFF